MIERNSTLCKGCRRHLSKVNISMQLSIDPMSSSMRCSTGNRRYLGLTGSLKISSICVKSRKRVERTFYPVYINLSVISVPACAFYSDIQASSDIPDMIADVVDSREDFHELASSIELVIVS